MLTSRPFAHKFTVSKEKLAEELLEEREMKSRVDIFYAAKRWITDCTIYLDWENTVCYADLVNMMSMVSAKHLLTGYYVFTSTYQLNNFFDSISYPTVYLYDDNINELELFVEACVCILVEKIRRIKLEDELKEITEIMEGANSEEC